MQLCLVSKLPTEQFRDEYKPASKLDRSKLWKLAEQLDIPGKELNRLAKEVVGREFGDCGRLTGTENRKVRTYLESNRRVLGERYRKMIWNKTSQNQK